MSRFAVWGVIVVLTGLLLLVLVWQPRSGDDDQVDGEQPVLQLAAVPEGGDFELQSHQGAVSLSSFRGQVVVLYFGYTWCPDVCPTSLGMLSVALDKLPAEQQAQVQVLFVSVDPERDTLSHLKQYGEYFHPRILGVTGSHEQLEDVARLYGAAYRHVAQESATEYVVDHSADLYVVDRQGRLADILRHGTTPDQILSNLQQLLNQN